MIDKIIEFLEKKIKGADELNLPREKYAFQTTLKFVRELKENKGICELCGKEFIKSEPENLICQSCSKELKGY